MELLTLKFTLLLFGGGGNLYNLDEMEREMIFYKPWKKIFSNLFSTRKKCVSLNYGNFCRTTCIYNVVYLIQLVDEFQSGTHNFPGPCWAKVFYKCSHSDLTLAIVWKLFRARNLLMLSFHLVHCFPLHFLPQGCQNVAI